MWVPGAARVVGLLALGNKDNNKDARDGEDCIDITESATCTRVLGFLALLTRIKSDNDTDQSGSVGGGEVVLARRVRCCW